MADKQSETKVAQQTEEQAKNLEKTNWAEMEGEEEEDEEIGVQDQEKKQRKPKKDWKKDPIKRNVNPQ